MKQSLQTLLSHAEHERDEAKAALLQAEEAGRRLHQQWQQLQAYHADYAARAPTLGGRAAPIDTLRSHHAFMQRLDQALAQQQGLLQAAEQRVTQQRQTLLALETRVASVRKLQQRRLQEAQRNAQRLEQRRSDDGATRRRADESAMQRCLNESTAQRCLNESTAQRCVDDPAHSRTVAH